MMEIDTPPRTLETGAKRKETSPELSLLDLPGDILSYIATFIDLRDQLAFLSTHPSIRSLAQTHLSPLSSSIRHLVDLGPPYPQLLAKLPSLSLFLPRDDGRLFLDILVRARPRWILERLEYGRWNEEVWKEAFERRFLPSWKRYKGDDDTWRAIFLRTLGRIEHRNLGCTHEESWTRFLTLHRNGSASINRIYSRLFDPYEIYDELKHQNNFSSQPTQVRVVVHLHDIRIIALGVLLSTPSLFVNPNAHLLLHPPLLRETFDKHVYRSNTPSGGGAIADIPSSTTVNKESSRAIRFASDDPMTAALQTSNDTTRQAPPSSPSIRDTLANLLPGRNRSLSTGAAGTDNSLDGPSRLGGLLTTVRSRDRDGGPLSRIRSRDRDEEGRRRPWSINRSRSRNSVISIDTSGPTNGNAPFSQPDNSASPTEANGDAAPSKDFDMPMPFPSHGHGGDVIGDTLTSVAARERARMPYSVMDHPRASKSYLSYPNFTPPPPTVEDENEAPRVSDTRLRHDELEDDEIGMLWSAGEANWGDDGMKMTELDPTTGVRRRWVGPMILIAQLHPSDRTSAHPSGSSPYGPLEGQDVDLGPKGMYVSMGFEDLEAIAPWVQLRATGANSSESRRSGMGFL